LRPTHEQNQLTHALARSLTSTTISSWFNRIGRVTTPQPSIENNHTSSGVHNADATVKLANCSASSVNLEATKANSSVSDTKHTSPLLRTTSAQFFRGIGYSASTTPRCPFIPQSDSIRRCMQLCSLRGHPRRNRDDVCVPSNISQFTHDVIKHKPLGYDDLMDRPGYSCSLVKHACRRKWKIDQSIGHDVRHYGHERFQQGFCGSVSRFRM
jgi:hypothetical protein